MLWPVLDVDPNSVQAGWLPLLLIVVLGLVIAGLGWSMAHEMKKIKVPSAAELAEADAAARASADDGAERASADSAVDEASVDDGGPDQGGSDEPEPAPGVDQVAGTPETDAQVPDPTVSEGDEVPRASV